MIAQVVLCAALVAVALGNTDSKIYMDGLLKNLRDEAISIGLDPVRIEPFQLNIKGNGTTDRDLEFNVTHGSIFGIGSVTRRGDCVYRDSSRRFRVVCWLALHGLRALLNADIKGDSTSEDRHSISIYSLVDNLAYFRVEIEKSNVFYGKVSSIRVPQLKMVSSVTQGKLDVNKTRLDEVLTRINGALAQQLTSALTGPFSKALDKMAEHRHFP